MIIKDYKLIQTCYACPEQYDVYKNDIVVAYLRLRHGYFYAEVGSTIVYDASPEGDGIFDSKEREYFLTKAIDAIDNFLSEE